MARTKILVIKPSSLGDVVHTLPAVAAVRQANPGAQITWLINPEWAPLLRGNPYIDHVHFFPRGQFRGLGLVTRLPSWLQRTRKLRPDVALDFQGLLRSALIAKISGAKRIIGLSDGREGSRSFYDEIAPVNRTEHAVARYLKLAQVFGAEPRQPLTFALPSGDPLPRFDQFPPFVVLHPHARGRRKSIARSVVAEFCRALAPARVVVVGHSRRRLTSPPENCLELTNQTTLLQLVWLMRHAAFVISVDSGPMHIAAALTSNLISIHTWSDPRRVGPYNRAAWIWKNGILRKAGDLDTTEDLGKGRRFRRDDVKPVAELALSGIA